MVRVGSKAFTESYVLAEVVSQVIERTGEATVDRKFGMGATGILAEAVRSGAIDIYPEYSGTIAETILHDTSARELREIRERLGPRGLTIGRPLGFNNTYAIGVTESVARRERLRTVSDLAHSPRLRFGVSYEFLNRPDGFKPMEQAYGLNLGDVRPMEHSLAYEALAHGELDAIDVYSTDAKIEKYGLRLLADDRQFFPKYYAVLLVRGDFARRFPRSWAALQSRLGDAISDVEMRKLNVQADLEKKNFRAIAADFLNLPNATPTGEMSDFAVRLRQHLGLVFGALLPAIAVGVPLGILASRRRFLAKAVLSMSGIVQTVPSLALLCFLIPIFGVGNPPALFALFLYALLPIVSGTFLGLSTIDIGVLDSETALGLGTLERLRYVELPLAMPSILSGIRTSAIVSIGTATLAALIGAGGFGVPIVMGLALNDIPTILQGAIPAALLALIASWVFDLLGRHVIRGPKRAR